MFKKISASASGIHFNNTLYQTDSLNVLNNESLFNGAGVGIGDFNNDSLPDIYFAGNRVGNKLYLNKGKFTFQDITDASSTSGEGRWCKGVSVVDINNDGWADIYVCASFKSSPQDRKNLLYINKGLNASGIPHFDEMAEEYGLADTTYSTQAAFFDYDNDGDLDMYLLVNALSGNEYPNTYRPIIKDGKSASTDRLYRNDFDTAKKHPIYTNVSAAAGILQEGYGHGVSITDINVDGWPDIYVTNDYIQNDLLWINQQNGTFKDQLSVYFKHTSNNGMGNDINDINNDGLMDVVALDMFPEDNYRLKTMLNPFSYAVYQNNDYFGYNYEYMRNTLQLNQGPRILGNDSVGPPAFSEISFYSGIAATDWSWTPMTIDVDNDGYRDLIITNGFPKDMTDHDFIAYRQQGFSAGDQATLLSQLPEVKIHNYGFRNNGNCTFSNTTKDWGFTDQTFTHGAAYADFDNDGDIDMVGNNMNDEALLYENTQVNTDTTQYIQFKLLGDSINRNAIGAKVDIYYASNHQVYELYPTRGYLSSVEPIVHFGLGKFNQIDSVVVTWPSHRQTVLQNVRSNQTVFIQSNTTRNKIDYSSAIFNRTALLTDITALKGIDFVHQETDFIDFSIQKMIPHKLSEYGPALAVGDVDGNGIEDIVVGGSKGNFATLLLQQANGNFVKKSLFNGAATVSKASEDMGLLLLDIDGDKDLDLLTTSGSAEIGPNQPAYQDAIYINDGKGNFLLGKAEFPKNFTSKSCIRASDIDRDGDMDLFIGGRVLPGKYPTPVSSFIYRNDSKKGIIRFTDITGNIAPALNNIGMVTDALFSDFDNDGYIDLIIAGEFMPVTFLKFKEGKFSMTIPQYLEKHIGWFNSIVAADFDNDGDMDYVVGNVGQNSFYKATDAEPVSIYAKDFNGDGLLDAIPSLYLLDALGGKRKQFPAASRDELIKEVIGMKARFQTYKDYAAADMNKVLNEEEQTDAMILQATNFKSILFKNRGKGRFEISPLPMQAQIGALYGMVAEDVNGDGNVDLVINGNDYGTEVNTGRYDALNGLVLLGDGKGNLKPQSIYKSGFYIPGNGKALVKLKSASNQPLIAASQNRGPLKLYAWRNPVKLVNFLPGEVYATLIYTDGHKRKVEYFKGDSFLSQSSSYIITSSNLASIIFTDYNKKERTITLSNQ